MFKKLFILGMLITSLFGGIRELTDDYLNLQEAKPYQVLKEDIDTMKNLNEWYFIWFEWYKVRNIF